MKRDVRKKMKIISGDGRKHFRISQPEATEDSKNTRYSTFLAANIIQSDSGEGDGRVKPVS